MKFGKYKVIICGSRGINNNSYNKLKPILDKYFSRFKDKRIVEVVSGFCKDSPDMIGERYAIEELGATLGNGLRRFPADWKHYGKQAGMMRNSEMAQYSTHCLAFWDGSSLGTKNMILTAKKLGLEVTVIKVERKEKVEPVDRIGL